MNWKRILIISMLVNLILLAAIWYKYSMKNHPSTEKIDALVQSSLYMNSRAIEGSVEQMKPTLDKKPRLRKTIIESVPKMREASSNVIDRINGMVMKIETIQNDTGGIDLERRVLPYQLLKEDGGLDSMQQFIARHLVFMDQIFEETILNSKDELGKLVTKNYVENVRSSIPKLDIDAKIKSLKNISLLESRLVLHSIQLDMSNVESVYINAIADLIPSRHKTRFEKLKVVINPKSSRVKVGEKYEAELAVAGYFPSFAKNSTIKINGKEYPFSEDGLVHYKVKPNRVGKHTLKLEAHIVNELSGEKMSSSSTYEYNVLP